MCAGENVAHFRILSRRLQVRYSDLSGSAEENINVLNARTETRES